MNRREKMNWSAAGFRSLDARTVAELSSKGIPRLPDGKPNLTAPDGKPDLSGIWQTPGPK